MNRVAPLEGRLSEIYRNQLSAQDDAEESVNHVCSAIPFLLSSHVQVLKILRFSNKSSSENTSFYLWRSVAKKRSKNSRY